MKIKINWFNTVCAAIIAIGVPVFPFVNPCKDESARVCTWHAQEMGNGVGRPFTNFYGINLYHP